MASPEKRVLFVCLGNICRSPAAEGVMRSFVEREGLSDSIEVSSAGTIGMHAGCLPDARMREAAAKRGYELKSRAKQLRAEDFERFDLIVTMDDDNRRNALRLVKNDSQRAKLRRFCEFCTSHPYSEVPDPYYGGPEGFELVLDLLEDGCRGVLAQLRASLR